ncbi:glycerophosphoryl diester phosphodiesterase [Halogranum gelatinilyticum]|uniref:Glycerophosphoryl diester phosphodiesterase n=1 Tax=Halogranum gelatinilyticum TaxID=660521 RepID=A0A1G9T486_9EURY|nr:glycerophosphodiester phosphodiesterase [Halogranum gelatinilyticum]SDM42427.1 glycerophosphoryl diester phosphodiesterase [Halogranum gelatinilyticum]
MRLIGHRGCPAHAPENTVAAVERAVEHVDMVEIDVQRCGSGELVVFHDEALTRLTGADGLVRETDWETLRDLRVDGSDEGIPLLSELLDAVPPSVGVNVELKHAGMAGEVVAELSGRGNEFLVSSFESDALREVRERSDVPLAYLFAEEWAKSLATATDLGCAYVHPLYTLLLEVGDESRVDEAHGLGFEVNAWTVPTREEVEELRGRGVDGVIVDDWRLV